MLVFSMGAVGTMLTALRLWKSVSVSRPHANLLRAARWQSVTVLFSMISLIELCVIAMCASLPTLTGWWHRKKLEQQAASSSSLTPSSAAAPSGNRASAAARRHLLSANPNSIGA
jgi:hypothetical protein